LQETLIPGPVFLISGVPGAGKSSVSEALVKRFPFGLHIPVDDLRGWVASGIAHPIPEWTDETTRQFRLARRAACETARIYSEAGFAVGVDDVLFPFDAENMFAKPLAGLPLHKVLLRPSMEEALLRNATRTNKTFDTSVLAGEVRSLHESMGKCSYERWGWTIIDTTHLTPKETVDEILRRVGE
jgi:chloramphenicol 3-O-phosphotransferase